MSKRKILALVAAFAVAIPLALTTTTAGASAPSAGISSTEIKVGGLIESQFAGSDVGAKARFADENANGGVNGRKFTFVDPTYYKQGDTAGALAEGQRLVQQEGVAAIVPALTSVPPATFLTQQKIPAFSWNITPLGWDNPYYFGITGSLVAPFPKTAPGSASLPDMLTKARQSAGGASSGKSTVAIVGSDDASSSSGVNQAAKTFTHEGYKVTYAKGALSLTTPTTDYTPFTQAILTSNGGKAPDTVYLVLSFADVQGLAKSLRQAGFAGVIVNPTTYDPRIVKAAETLDVYTQWATPEAASDNPGIAKVVDSIHKLQPDAALSLGTLAGWFAADMFIQAVKAAGKNVTSQSIQKAASKMTYQIKGTVGPTTYPAAYTLGTSCAQLAHSDGSAFQVVVPYGCYPAFVFGTSTSSKPKKVIPAPKG